MKKKVIILLIIGVLVIGGIVALVLCLNKNTKEFEIVQKTNGGVPLQ